MKNQDKPASFINKLYSILKSKQHTKVIVWDTQHKGIRVLNQKKLEQTVLPRYYRHNRFASFVRQLNMYDFHKIHLGDHKSVFTHQNFDPKKKQTIYMIKRKVTLNNQTTQKNSNSQQKQVLSVQKQSPKPIESIKSFKSVIQSDKQNFWSHRSSFILVRNSLKMLSSNKFVHFDQVKTVQEQIEQLVKKILQLNLETHELIKQRISMFKKDKMYRTFLRKKQSIKLLYQRLGVQFDDSNENLSQLSIQGQLMIQTRRTLTQKSLKMFESGPINYRQSLGNFLNL